MLFLRAVTGSDTTSASYQQGKKKGYKVLKSNDQLRQTVTVFITPQANPADIAKTGDKFLLSLYSTSTFNSLDDFRVFLQDLPSSSAIAGEQHQSCCMGMDSILWFPSAKPDGFASSTTQTDAHCLMQLQSWLHPWMQLSSSRHALYPLCNCGTHIQQCIGTG